MARNPKTKTEDSKPQNATPQGLGEPSETVREATTAELTNGTTREDF